MAASSVRRARICPPKPGSFSRHLEEMEVRLVLAALVLAGLIAAPIGTFALLVQAAGAVLVPGPGPRCGG